MVPQALVEYIQRRKQLQVLALFGTVDYAEGFDTKAQRNLSRAPLTAEQQACIHALGELVADGRAALIGPIRQELLSGVKTVSQFEALRDSLTAFDDLALSMGTYDLAAECFNICRTKGVQGSNTDFLICAAAIQHQLPIFTLS